MRALFCKIHLSLICFCKPSSSHLYTPSPLKLENTPQPPLPPESNSLASGQAFEAQSISISNGNGSCNDHHPSENGLKSSLRKPSPESSLVEKKKVQWVDDVFGKQLVEIKEFEPSEDEDTADFQRVNDRRCVCTIL